MLTPNEIRLHRTAALVALKRGTITQKQYEEIMRELNREEEKMKRQGEYLIQATKSALLQTATR